ncbi:hypothetical protein TNCV_4190713 [Trichonephila clavipes]|nr:hypothetical protein TNCV_4190713 [Trichonephila clavipes]
MKYNLLVTRIRSSKFILHQKPVLCCSKSPGVSTINNAENQNQNFPASIPKVSTVRNVNVNSSEEQTSLAQTSKITVSSVNNVKQEPSSSVQTSETTASTSSNSDEALAYPPCDPKSNCEQKSHLTWTLNVLMSI